MCHKTLVAVDFMVIIFNGYYCRTSLCVLSSKKPKVSDMLHCRYINNLTSEEAELTRSLAYEIVRRQQRHMVVSPWALMAAVLMQSREGVSVRELPRETDWLKRQLVNLGAYVDWPGQ